MHVWYGYVFCCFGVINDNNNNNNIVVVAGTTISNFLISNLLQYVFGTSFGKPSASGVDRLTTTARQTVKCSNT